MAGNRLVTARVVATSHQGNAPLKGNDVTPGKLRDDAIVEAVCQVRFTARRESEVVVGRLSDFPDGEYRLSRLPLAEMPPSLRQADPSLRHQPLLELRHAERPLMMRIGDGVISVHLVGVHAYAGWSIFKVDVAKMLTQLFGRVPSVHIDMLTLRYINAIVESRHKLKDVGELKLQVMVADQPFLGPVNVNFSEVVDATYGVTTRVAHTSFVQGNLPDGTVAIIDVEVSSPKDHRVADQADAVTWFERAHTLEKAAFFKLLPDHVLVQLVEE